MIKCRTRELENSGRILDWGNYSWMEQNCTEMPSAVSELKFAVKPLVFMVPIEDLFWVLTMSFLKFAWRRASAIALMADFCCGCTSQNQLKTKQQTMVVQVGLRS